MAKEKKFPKPISIWQMLGPSFVILALGLGSGEVILWPYLSANYGMGIAWAAVLGITFQFFVNMEIERYALVKGESVFAGLVKIFKWAPWWFILSTFVGFAMPGMMAAAAKVFGSYLGWEEFKWIAIVGMLLIGLVLSFGKTIYSVIEQITQVVIVVAVPMLLVFVIVLASAADWGELLRGLTGQGIDYQWIPENMDLMIFLGAFAYAGAGGNLNLTQSIYIREKGYGMGKYAQKIGGLFQGALKEQKLKLSGESFKINKENMANFREWWKRVNIEHALVFWFIGAAGILLLMLLAFVTVYGQGGNDSSINFVISEAGAIKQILGTVWGGVFMVVVAIMLWQTQMGVLDSTSRIMSENYALVKLGKDEKGSVNISRIYFAFLWAQIIVGIIMFALDFKEPKTLLVVGAVINAVAMFVHVGMVNWMNWKVLPKEVQAGILRKVIIVVIFVFYGIFAAVTLGSKFL
ncbi:Nramp family divalent metal transporter [Patescibacteria group bacterium]|nr:Nramp family divalent metal transporter [Patescibacteria group bacterium]